MDEFLSENEDKPQKESVRERIKNTIIGVHQPESAREIAKKADCSVNAARNYLSIFLKDRGDMFLLYSLFLVG